MQEGQQHCHPAASCPSGTLAAPASPSLIPAVWMAVPWASCPAQHMGITQWPGAHEKHKTLWLG